MCGDIYRRCIDDFKNIVSCLFLLLCCLHSNAAGHVSSFYGMQCVDNGKEINLAYAVKAKTITSGLKYSLATGNWGQANTAGTRAGVSQVIA